MTLGSAACSTGVGIDAGGEWTRFYLKPYEQVFAGAVRALEEIGAAVDIEDPERGRIQATIDQRARSVVLDVRVEHREETVRVDVLARSGVLDAPAQRADTERAVRSYLDELDRTLRVRPE